MNLVTDRTSWDVERWRVLRDKGWDGMTETERQEWLGEITTTPSATKGMYTHNDLNRVESAVEVLSTRLKELGYIPRELEVKTDWTYTDEISREDMSRYFDNVSALRHWSTTYPNTPEAPNINQKLTHELANNIEKILADIDEISQKIPESWYYVGEIIAGEV